MTKKETIDELEYLKSALDGLPPETGVIETLAALNTAIKALEEIQKYREIGSVEWCREAVEKQIPKRPRLNSRHRFLSKDTYTCPRCGNVRLEEYANERQNNNFCWNCGQALDWSEEE